MLFTVEYNIEIEMYTVTNVELSSVNIISHILNSQCKIDRMAFMYSLFLEFVLGFMIKV